MARGILSSSASSSASSWASSLAAAAFAVAGLVFAGTARADDVRVIVGFKGAASPDALAAHGGRATRTLDRLHAVAGTVPPSAIAALRARADVAWVEEDGIAEASGKPSGSGGKPPPAQPPQSTPWGVTKVGAPLGSGNVGAGIDVAVIDTGIDLDHPDLAAHVRSGVNLVRDGKPADDDNGHGSHVAGTIGALDNTIGVVGVAPGCTLWAVKCLDRNGSGFWSDVAAGITWAADNGMRVANMSLGGGHSAAVESACADAESRGVLLVAAAGNEGDGNTSTTETSYPAAYASVVATGATNSSDGLASFSNTGSYVEVSGPGVSVPSTYKGAGYATLSGTSMASPHAAGIAVLLWKDLLDLDSAATVAAVRASLDVHVRDAGPAGRDAGYGFGIVDYTP